MKATLYRIPSKNILVFEDKDGKRTAEFAPTEARASQIAQDRGCPTITFGMFDDLLNYKSDKKIKMQ